MHAVGLPGLPSSPGEPTQHVFTMGDRREMPGIYATPDAAEMIKLGLLWNRSARPSEAEAMGKQTRPADANRSIAAAV